MIKILLLLLQELHAFILNLKFTNQTIPAEVKLISSYLDKIMVLSFSFANNHYKQVNGGAIGTKMGPSYANLSVGYIENQFFTNIIEPNLNFTAGTSTIALALLHLA